MKSRRTCRECAVQGVYRCDILGDMGREGIEEFLSHLEAFPGFIGLTEDDKGSPHAPETEGEYAAPAIKVGEYCRTLLYGVLDNLATIDAAIGLASTNWGVSRMLAVDRCILRVATYELLFSPDVPAKVVINEAIEISRDFSGEESYGFINGVLDRVRESLPGVG